MTGKEYNCKECFDSILSELESLKKREKRNANDS
jgi:hypothetical protein